MPVAALDTSDLPFGGGGSAYVNAISCWASTECVAGGGYTLDGHGYTHAFLAVESRAHWNKAFTVPGLDNSLDGEGNTVPDSEVTWILCRAAGSCSVGGTYTDDLNAICFSCHQNAFVVNQVNGEWYRAIRVPGLKALNDGDSATLDVGDCAAVGFCEIAGTFLDGQSPATFQLYTAGEINGTWQEARQLTYLQPFDPRGAPKLSALACSTPTNCTTTGTFANGASFKAILLGGAWQMS